jgi:hypothetical protein
MTRLLEFRTQRKHHRVEVECPECGTWRPWDGPYGIFPHLMTHPDSPLTQAIWAALDGIEIPAEKREKGGTDGTDV